MLVQESLCTANELEREHDGTFIVLFVEKQSQALPGSVYLFVITRQPAER